MTYREFLAEISRLPSTDLDRDLKYFDVNEGQLLDLEWTEVEDVVDDFEGPPHLPILVSVP